MQGIEEKSPIQIDQGDISTIHEESQFFIQQNTVEILYSFIKTFHLIELKFKQVSYSSITRVYWHGSSERALHTLNSGLCLFFVWERALKFFFVYQHQTKMKEGGYKALIFNFSFVCLSFFFSPLFFISSFILPKSSQYAFFF